ncbi:hypothetical protein D3C85_1660770 [compost metagenome]
MSEENCRGLGLDHRWAKSEFSDREYCSKCGEARYPLTLASIGLVSTVELQARIAKLEEALEYAVEQVPELGTVPGIADALKK